MRHGSLFSGYGGLDMGVQQVLPGELAWVCEKDPAAARVLAHRYPGVPNLGDITAVNWDQVEPVDVLTGGFPCQDVSVGGRRAGLTASTRSGLWSHMAAAIGALRPSLVVIENVRGMLSAAAGSDVEPCPWCLGDPSGEPALRALGAVLGDLADVGFDAEWVGLPAADVGAPHGRFRVFILAWPATYTGRRPRPEADADRPAPGRSCGVAEVHCAGGPDRARTDWGPYEAAIGRWGLTLGRPAPTPTEPGSKGQTRLAAPFVEWMMGLPAGWVTAIPGLSRTDMLRLLGNGVVPQQIAAALPVLLDRAFSRAVAA